jgi:hypothetical protein
MKNIMKLYLLSCALILAVGSPGNSRAAANSDVPQGAWDIAKAQVFDVGFKRCGEYWGSFEKKPPPMVGSDTEYQFKNLRMVIEKSPFGLSTAQKMNGLQWEGQINLSAEVTRERVAGQKEWGNWSDGYVAPNMGLTVQEVNGKWRILGLDYWVLRAACPN